MDNLLLALEHLSKDPVMKGLIEKLPAPETLEKVEDPVMEVIETVVSQQLSDKAAGTIFSRFKQMLRDPSAACGGLRMTGERSGGLRMTGEKKETLMAEKKFDPEEILLIQDQKIRDCGVSFAKVKCIKSFCRAIVEGKLNLDKLDSLSDEEVAAELTAVWGIGRWTAEMILMFTLKRPDVFSLKDLGLRTAVSQLYFVERSDLIKIEEISRQWSPYRSIASRYLWKSLEV